MMKKPEEPIRLMGIALMLAAVALLLTGCATKIVYRESAVFTVDPLIVSPCGTMPPMPPNPSPFVVLMQKTEEARIASCEKTRRAIMIDSYNKYLEAKNAGVSESVE